MRASICLLLCFTSALAQSCTKRRALPSDDDSPANDAGDIVDSDVPPDSGDEIDAAPPTDSGPGEDAGSCEEVPCRLVFPQCGCPLGDACDIDGATRICRDIGTAAEGQACSDVARCEAGLTCVGPEDGVNYCVRYCTTDSDCVGAGSLCIGQLSDEGGVIPGVNVCTTNCDPANGTGCAATYGCTIFRESSGAMRHFTSCRPAGLGEQGDACSTEDTCASGHRCYMSQCASWCDLGSGTGCTGGTSCNTTTVTVTIGATEFGTCQ